MRIRVLLGRAVERVTHLVVGLIRESCGPAPLECFTAPLAEAAEQLYLTGHRAGLGRRDDSTVIEVLRGTPATST